MSRKDFRAIALVLNRQYYDYIEGADSDIVWQVAEKLADSFEAKYPNFDRHKFLTAVGAVG